MEETLYIFPTFISMKYISIPFSFTYLSSVLFLSCFSLCLVMTIFKLLCLSGSIFVLSDLVDTDIYLTLCPCCISTRIIALIQLLERHLLSLSIYVALTLSDWRCIRCLTPTKHFSFHILLPVSMSAVRMYVSALHTHQVNSCKRLVLTSFSSNRNWPWHESTWWWMGCYCSFNWDWGGWPSLIGVDRVVRSLCGFHL